MKLYFKNVSLLSPLSQVYVFYFLSLITLIEKLEFENKEPFAGKKKRPHFLIRIMY